MDSRIISNLLHGRNSSKLFIGSKMTRISKVWKVAIFRHFAKAIYSNAELSKMPDCGDEIEIDKIRNTANLSFSCMVMFVSKDSRNLYLPSVVVRGEGERPWIRGCGQITYANFNGIKIASYLCMCLRLRWFPLGTVILSLQLLLHLLTKKKYSFYSCACAYILLCFDLFCLFSKGIVYISDASASTQMRSLILWLRLPLMP